MIQLLVQLMVEQLGDWMDELEGQVQVHVLVVFDLKVFGFLVVVDIAFLVAASGVVVPVVVAPGPVGLGLVAFGPEATAAL